MLVNNLFQMNDWKYRHFIVFVVMIQILTLVMVGLKSNGFIIPVLTPLVIFLYLTFVPGFLILRALRIHNLGSVKSTLYAIGLSVLSVMFLGFFINMTGISKPISLTPLITTITIFIIILSFLSFFRDRKFSNENFIDTKDLFTPKVLFLCVIPFLSIFGTYFVNNYNNNLVSIILIMLIGVIALLVVFNKFHEKLNPFIVWIISISLLFSSSLISSYIFGWDIQNEYYLANIVLNESYWNFNLGDAYNAMLSVVMLGPIYSILSGIDLVYVLKIIYPFLFSLVPVGLYSLFKEQTNPKIAFLASFLFVSFSTFFMILPSEGREMIAELFLVLFLLILFSNKSNQNLVLLSIFGIGLVISHYSLTFFLIFILIASIILILIYNFIKIKLNYKGTSKSFLNSIKDYSTNFVIICMLLIFSYLWYQNIAGGSILNLTEIFGFILEKFLQKIVYFQTHLISLVLPITILLIIILAIALLFIRFKKRSNTKSDSFKFIGAFLASKWKYYLLAILSLLVFVVFLFLVGKPQTVIIAVQRYLNFILVFFAITGLIVIGLNIAKNNFKIDYKIFSLISALILVAGIFIPVFENGFNITRIFNLTFIFLAPICVCGAVIVTKSIIRSLKIKTYKDMPLKIVSIFLIIFMLFNTGFFSVLTNTSIPIHLNSESDTYPRFDYQETLGSQWVYENRISDKIYADEHGVLLFKKYLYSVPSISSYNEENNSYIFERKLNKGNIFLVTIDVNAKEKTKSYQDLSGILINKNRIYDNGEAKCYFK